MPETTTVDAHIAALAPERRAVMESLRQTIRAAAPDATEAIAYDMPAYRTSGGRFIVSFGSFKAHYSLFPASDVVVERLGDAIRPYLAGRGTIRFPAGRPVPIDLVRRVVEIRVEETSGRGG